MRSDEAGTRLDRIPKFRSRGIPDRQFTSVLGFFVLNAASPLRARIYDTLRSRKFSSHSRRAVRVKMYSRISGEQNDQFVREMKLPNGRERAIPDGEQRI